LNIATLTVEGMDDEALDTLRIALNLVPEKTWKKGDPTRRGDLHLSSGFSFTIADAANPRELIEAIRGYLASCREHTLLLSKPDLSTELSIGISVGDSTQFMACLEFTPADLLLLTEMGIHLTVCAYPTSDEANEEDPPA
jgi:hypothetical protein